MISWLLILFLFLVGLRLSAFFSGIETAFYRVSKLRLNIDAQTGDTLSQKMLAYAVDPSRFVATILIGNNLANYVTTYAIGLGAILAFGTLSETMEVAVTIAFSPLIFIFGELLPKTLHYRAPLMLLKRYFRIFHVVHLLLLPLSWPLIVVTRLFQKVGGGNGARPMLQILGRRPLATVIGQGREEGVVTPVQHNLIQGVFANANKTIDSLIIPEEVAFSFESEVSLAALLSHAKKYGLVEVPLMEQTEQGARPIYFRVADLLLWNGPVNEIARTMPRVSSKTSRLETLLVLQQRDEDLAAIYEGDQFLGIVKRMALSESLHQGGLSLQDIPF
ncbi:MAG: DUF21 domain-containing protein [Planctomycetaceae bacterium]|nr:DUF21 domain-containing protein [Planctomycetaceae bacterium]